MALAPISNYPANEASGIPRNATISIRFTKTLDYTTVNYITVSVAAPVDDYVPVEGAVSLAASAPGSPDNTIKFNPDPAFDSYKRYGIFISAGSDGVKAYDGDILRSSLEYYFTTSSGTFDDATTEVPATGVPEPSSYIPTNNLQVLSTYPANYATDVDLNLDYIRITFNDAIPSGVNIYDFVKITNKDIL